MSSWGAAPLNSGDQRLGESVRVDEGTTSTTPVTAQERPRLEVARSRWEQGLAAPHHSHPHSVHKEQGVGQMGRSGGFLMPGVWQDLRPRGPARAREGRGEGFVSGNASMCF